MTELKDRIFVLGEDDLDWGFRAGFPSLKGRKRGGYVPSFQVDPFPAEHHSPDLVLEIAEQVEATFPLPPAYRPHYYLFQYEDEARTNGSAGRNWIYTEKKEDRTWEPYITLSGKRIPLHPAMTRYLVAHEYGHIVDFWLQGKRGLEDGSTVLDKEYAKMRGLDPEDRALFRYGGRRWPFNCGEVITNDARILLFGIEPEFWPHPYPRPDEVPGLREWWEKERDQHAWKGEPVEGKVDTKDAVPIG